MTKSFSISKQTVWEAYKLVKANRGEAGVDGQAISDFERNLKSNLYKIWNRMSSGSYCPPPVREVEIPKADGKIRKLGIPTVSDRIAQMVVKKYLEPKIEPCFHKDSFGYRPGKSAIEAVGVARQRCWRYNWVLDMDIKGFFDNIDHDLMMRAVRKHTSSKWILLYVERWLKAPIQKRGGNLQERKTGTPQGGVISPLLANLFLHYAFDEWMRRNYNLIPFERYADDVVVHCRSVQETRFFRKEIGQRLKDCKLELHPEKTKIVYCQDDRRQGNYPDKKFDFLGYTFRARQGRSRTGKFFVSFNPAVSQRGKKALREKLRSKGTLRNTQISLEHLAEVINPIVKGWVNYYNKFYKSALYPTIQWISELLIKWVRRKYKMLRYSSRKARHWLGRVAKRDPHLFAHWSMGYRPAVER
jgi:RNA-directed DNA polymerase